MNTLIISSLTSALVGVLWYASKQIVEQLKAIATNVNEIKVELSALVTDHENVKDDIKELKARIYDLEHS